MQVLELSGGKIVAGQVLTRIQADQEDGHRIIAVHHAMPLTATIVADVAASARRTTVMRASAG